MRRFGRVILLLALAVVALSLLLPGRAHSPEKEDIPRDEGPASLSGEALGRTMLSPGREPGCSPDEGMGLTVWSEGTLQVTSMAEYLPGVLAGEMPADFCGEALRAQAVAARTYLLYKLRCGCAKHPEAVVCDDPACCKAWLSESALRERWGEDFAENMAHMTNAVRDTDGEYLSYEGEPIQAVFHASSGGKTESSGSIWQDLPYLVSVDSPETEEEVPGFVSETELSPDALREKVLSLHPAARFDPEPANWLGEFYRNESGRVTYGTLGDAALSGMEMRKLFSLRSTCFTLEYTGEVFHFRVVGYGHGVGMSQYGANVLGNRGESYGEILSHYYPGTELRRMGENWAVL